MHQLAGNQTALGAWDRLARRADVGPKCCKEANDASKRTSSGAALSAAPDMRNPQTQPTASCKSVVKK